MSELISDCFINSANSTVYGGLALAQTNQLQSVINAAARVIIGGIPKFNLCLTTYVTTCFGWQLEDALSFMLLCKYLAGCTSANLGELCTSVSSSSDYRSIRSATQDNLVVLLSRTVTVQLRTFEWSAPQPSTSAGFQHLQQYELLLHSKPLFRKRLNTIRFEHDVVLSG